MFFFFFNDTATTEIYTLSLHDALPISSLRKSGLSRVVRSDTRMMTARLTSSSTIPARISRGLSRKRSEEHTSELQSRFDLVCRLLLEKKKEINDSRLLD